MTDVLDRQQSLGGGPGNSEDTIVSRFERQAAAAPDRLAIVTDEASLTYRALALRMAAIAAALVSQSIQSDQPIVLFMNDEVARVAAILGVLKANLVFVPVASNSPAEWLTQVIEDSGAALILANGPTRAVAELAARDRAAVMDVDTPVPTSRSSAAERDSGPDDTAYVVYTSGSTGKPKGVANSHRRVVHNSDVRCKIFGLGRDDRIANLASSVGSAGLTHTFLCLLSGGTLFPFDLQRHGLQKLAPWLIAQNITYVSFFGSVLRTWLASLPDDLRFPSLAILGANGERLYADDVARIARHLEGDWRIGHCYSSTECGTIAAQTFSTTRLPENGVVTVGLPTDGVEVFIKDETGALVPPGGIGEIVVRGRFLAQGYWKSPELTAKAFETDPRDNSIRTYRTGDLGRCRSDGTIEHLGRKGRTIRLRGYNVEPFQVEGELRRQTGVTDAAVLLHGSDASEEPRLVGYVVAPATTSPSVMRKKLAERLPSYMVPSQIIVLDKFPIASSGKIDSAALPPPDRSEARPAAFRAPSDDYEHALLTIWQKALKIPNIGIDDDFFELGGSSLQALMVFSEIEAKLGRSLSPTTIVRAPTIALLADFIRMSTGDDDSQSLVPLRTYGEGEPLFLVHNRYCFVMYYRHLLSGLVSDRPVFGLQPPPLDGNHRIPRGVETMAADYVAEIRRIQPHGPYFVAGHSFGGLVSFEIAQQLVRQGEDVRFLGLIDTILRGPPNAAQPTSSLSSRAGRHLSAFIEKLIWIKEAVWKRWCILRLNLGWPIPYDERTAWYDWVCTRASRNYVPKPYAGHITMFSSAGNSERQKAHWGPLANGGLTVLEVPATHDDMVLPPHSKVLAKQFDDCLDRARAG